MVCLKCKCTVLRIRIPSNGRFQLDTKKQYNTRRMGLTIRLVAPYLLNPPKEYKVKGVNAMNKNVKILVVEDDNEINQLLCEVIAGSGYVPQPVYSGTEALLYLEKEQEWSMILLDLMIPGLSGEELLQQLGPERRLPVIIISAKGEQQTKVSALRMGADDYITKPFDVEEVAARIDIHLGRYRRVAAPDPIRQLTYKDIRLDVDAKKVTVNGTDVILTAREFAMLELLMTHPKKIYTKPNLFEAVWGEAYLGDDNTLTVHMSNLRKKLAQANPEAEYIETIWGMGYRLKG